ncbi:MAG: AmmeMemoRadiSam system radical SAM enzyme [Candidatus Bathyarchaeia archaeon]
MKEHLAEYKTVREALLYEKLSRNKVRCGLCERRCTINLGEKGFCKTRQNIDGKLYTLVYGDISTIESRPIEIKPFFHYWPGSTALTLSTWSCNFDCPWCQNFHLSKVEPKPDNTNFYPVDTTVDMALRREDEGLCISFQEPILLFEWALSLFKTGSRKGLYCCYVSNGYMTSEALRMLQNSGMNGLKIDIKGDTETYQKYCSDIDADKVWKNVREAKEKGVHVEIVNLLVRGVSDDETCINEIIEHHMKEAGPETPLHFNRYYPAYKFDNPPTKIETLERAYKMAKKAGIQYPYVGNVFGHKYENTYCPNCGELLIHRFSYSVRKYGVTKDKKCPKCGRAVSIRGNYIRKARTYFVA